MLCGVIAMLLQTGLSMPSGKKAKKKYKEQEVFLNEVLMLTIVISLCG